MKYNNKQIDKQDSEKDIALDINVGNTEHHFMPPNHSTDISTENYKPNLANYVTAASKDQKFK